MGARASRQKADITAPPAKESKKVKRKKSKKETVTANGDTGIEEVSIQNTETDSIVKPEEAKMPDANVEAKQVDEKTVAVSTIDNPEPKEDVNNKENTSPNPAAVPAISKDEKSIESIPETPKQEQSTAPVPEATKEQPVTQEQSELPKDPAMEAPPTAVPEQPKEQPSAASPEQTKELSAAAPEVAKEESSAEMVTEQPQIPAPEVAKETPSSIPASEPAKESEHKPISEQPPAPQQPSEQPPEPEPVKEQPPAAVAEQVVEQPVAPACKELQEPAPVPATEPAKEMPPAPEPTQEQSPTEPAKEQPPISVVEALPKQEAPPAPEPVKEEPPPPVSEVPVAPLEAVSELPAPAPPTPQGDVQSPVSETGDAQQSLVKSSDEVALSSVSPISPSTPEQKSAETVTAEAKSDSISKETAVAQEPVSPGPEKSEVSPQSPKEEPKEPSSEVHSPAKSVEAKITKIPTTVVWEHGGKEVIVCGSFSNWTDRISLTEKENLFSTIIDLPEGEHHFQYFVDGVQTVNKSLQQVEIEGHGQVNVIAVKLATEE